MKKWVVSYNGWTIEVGNKWIHLTNVNKGHKTTHVLLTEETKELVAGYGLDDVTAVLNVIEYVIDREYFYS